MHKNNKKVCSVHAKKNLLLINYLIIKQQLASFFFPITCQYCEAKDESRKKVIKSTTLQSTAAF